MDNFSTATLGPVRQPAELPISRGESTPLEPFLNYLQWEKGCAQATLKTYQRILLQFRQFFGEDRSFDWSRCQELDVRRWIAFLRLKKNLSPATLALMLSTLRSFYRWYARQTSVQMGVISFKFKLHKRRLPKVLSIDQMYKLLEIPPVTLIALRDRAMIECFYSCGLRLSELSGLTPDWLDVEQQLICVHGKGKKYRWVPIGKPALLWIQRWIQAGPPRAPHAPVFCGLTGRGLSARAIQKRIQFWALKLLGEPLNPHALRHTFATHMLSACQDLRAVQELLGHTKLATTQQYTHLDIQRLSAVYDNAHPRQTPPSLTR